MRAPGWIGAGPAPTGVGAIGAPLERAEPVSASPRTSAWSYRLLVVFLVLLYANVPLVAPELAFLAPAQTVAVAALLAVFLELTVARRALPLVFPESHLLVAFLGVCGLTCFTALWPRWAAEASLDLLRFVLVYFVIVHAVVSWPRLRGVCRTLALGGLIPAVASILHWTAGNRVEGRAAWLGIFANPNDLAYALVLLVPIALALGVTARARSRWIYFAAAATLVGAIFLTFSRSGLLALGVVLLLCLVRWSPATVWVPGVCLLFAGFSVALGTAWGRAEGFGDLVGDATLLQRVETIETGFRMFLDRPLAGVGLGCSVIGWPLYSEPGVSTTGWLHSHNTVIQVLGETGVVGALFYLGMIVVALRRARRLGRQWHTASRAPARRGMRRYRERYRELHVLVSGLEIALWGFVVCGLAAGLVLSWFPYLLLALVASAARLSAPFPDPEGR